MLIKKLLKQELLPALKLVWNVFLEFEAPDYSEQGINTFKNYIADEAMMFELEFYGAFKDDELLGIIAMRNKNHLTMLFTKKEHHKKGVAKLLFNHILQITDEKIFTVNSSPYAVEIYHKLGFTDTDNEKEINGIRFTSMQYRV
ncbi:hypothetical protein AN641_00270 [Candidatus Epulonipiscioides gigas]|nr:hypothetical protein AN641_00270 [Epulopiscium sp. SCG-C07WGA-EpuloA2]